MKKYIILIAVYFFAGFLLANCQVPSSLVNTLYTLSGIMFSVGMSLIVAANTQNIRNPDAKKEVQDNLNALLYRYIANFLTLTAIFAVTLIFKVDDKERFQVLSFNVGHKEFVFNYPAALVALEIVCILYYIINMMDTRKQFQDIETKIDQEQSK
ncbi:MAG: hypothetical protein J5490_05130 [Bacteroidales bacterium]|nr:hypothetical protein [Bacteroidales bacterium]